jgi:uncharacterized membrane protein YphA (DoxX/SURF4 family)
MNAMKILKQISVVDIVAFLFSFLFLYASISKLAEYDEFVAQIGKSPLITRYVDWLAWMIPAVEIAIVAMLYVPRLRLVALYASFTLMFAFTIYIIMILTLSPYVPCSCGGILNSMGWTEHVIFNIVFTLLAVLGIHYQVKTDSFDTEFHHNTVEI